VVCSQWDGDQRSVSDGMSPSEFDPASMVIHAVTTPGIESQLCITLTDAGSDAYDR